MNNFVYAVTTTYLPILLRNLGYTATMVGVLFAIGEVAAILGPFLFGRLADRSGKYKGFIALVYFLTAVAAFPLALFVHPVLSAILIAMLAVGYRSSTPLIDAITTINMGEKGNYGKIRLFGSIAFVFFVSFMQWTPVLRPNTPLNIAIWISFTSVLAIVVIILFPSKYTTRSSPPESSSPTESFGIIRNEAVQYKSIWSPVFILGLISIALSRFAMASVYSFFPLYMVEYIRWDAVGTMIALASITEIPCLFFSKRIIRRFGAMPLINFASAMVALRLALYALFPFRAGIIVAQLLHSFCFGIFHPAAVAFISNCVPPERRSFGMTLYLSLGWGVPTLMANFTSGFIIDHAGYRVLFGTFTVFPLLGAAIYFIYRSMEKPNLA